MKLLYFARLRESLGTSAEEVVLPGSVTDIRSLMDWLSARGGQWQQEFSGNRPLRAAINQALANESATVQNEDEVAFFPPVTGG